MNRVLSGRFKGKRVRVNKEGVYIKLGRGNFFPLDAVSVLKIEIIEGEHRPSFLSTYIRGRLTENMSSSMYLASILSSKYDYSYLCKVTYRDDSVSIMEVSKNILVNFNKLIELN